MRGVKRLVLAIVPCLVLTSLLAEAQTAPGQGVTQARAPAAGTIQGSVTGRADGKPIAGVMVRVRRETEVSGPPNPNEAQYVGSTGDDGRYNIVGVSPGDYRVYADMPPWVRRFYGARTDANSQGDIVHVDAGRTLSKVDIELLAQAKVSGRVTGEDGKPIPDLSVLALLIKYEGSSKVLFAKQKTETDGDGQYSIRGLPPGNYLIRVEHNLEVRVEGSSKTGGRKVQRLVVRPTYYPKAFAAETAVSLAVPPGGDIPNIDFKVGLVATERVCGIAEWPKGYNPKSLVLALVTVEFDVRSAIRPGLSTVQPGGKFCFDEILPGKYYLEPARFLVDVPADNALAGRLELEVRPGDVPEVHFIANPPIEMEGAVSSILQQKSHPADPLLLASVARQTPPARAGAPVPPPPGSGGNPTPDPPPQGAGGETVLTAQTGSSPSSNAGGQTAGWLKDLQVELLELDRLLVNAPTALTAADGKFRLEQVPTGRYRISVKNLPPGFYIQRISFNGQDLTRSALQAVASGTMSIVLSDGAREISGVAKDGKSVVSGASISIWPENEPDTGLAPLVRRVVARTDGQFTVGNLPPGRYRVLAMPEGLDPSLSENPVFCRAYERSAMVVAVDKSETGGIVSVTVSVVPLETVRAGGW